MSKATGENDVQPTLIHILWARPSNAWDWLFIVMGIGPPLFAYGTTSLNPATPGMFGGLGNALLMMAGCAFGGLVGLLGMVLGRRLSAWSLIVAIVFYTVWSANPPFKKPPLPPVHHWGRQDVTSIVPLSRGRIALCGPVGAMVILDSFGHSSVQPALQREHWCTGRVIAFDDGFLTLKDDALGWNNGKGSEGFVSFDADSHSLDAVPLSNGIIRVMSLTHHGALRVEDLDRNGVRTKVAEFPERDFAWVDGVVFAAGSVAAQSADLHWLTPSPKGMRIHSLGSLACQSSFVHARDPMVAILLPQQLCPQAKLWRMISGKFTSLDDAGGEFGHAFADAGEAGFFSAARDGIRRFDVSGHRLPFSAEFKGPIHAMTWDGRALLVLSAGRPFRYLPTGHLDEKFPWPIVETTADGQSRIR